MKTFSMIVKLSQMRLAKRGGKQGLQQHVERRLNGVMNIRIA
jgi:hypothetical protein